MTNDLAAPVKKLTQTWSRGVKLAKKFAKAVASRHEENSKELGECLRQLEQALEGDCTAVTAKYNQCYELHGEPFVEALVDDSANYSKLQDLRMDLIDLINQVQDLELDDFDRETFENIQTESGVLRDRCLVVFQSAVDSRWNQSWSFTSTGHSGEGISSLDGLSRSASGSTQASYSTTTTTQIADGIDKVVESAQGKQKDHRRSFTSDIPTIDSHGPTTNEDISSLHDKSKVVTSTDSANTTDDTRVDVLVKNNDDFLERRRLSKIAFYQTTRLSMASIGEINESDFDVVSPLSPTSPTDTRPRELRSKSSDDYTSLVNGKRTSGQASEKKRASVASSMRTSHTISEEAQTSGSRHVSDDFFTATSAGGGSTSTKDLAATLKLPDYGKGVEPGLETVETPIMIDRENEKIAVPNVHPNFRTPSSSVKSIDSPMRHDSSFYKFGGFCDGAKASLRGELGYKIANRPTGTWGTSDYAKCIRCSFEITLSQIEKDAQLDITGIYGSGHKIRWRQQFLTKSHVRTTAAEEPMYACLFCIEDRKTPEEHDATIFLSPTQLFAHLARHPRPFSKVNGLIVLYGKIPRDTTNFDLHVMQEESTPSKYNMTEIAPEVAVRPAGNALITYHPRSSRSNSKDPDGNPTLHFAAGARILGITFPEHFAGAWCIGYHDGAKGSFPSAAITLDLPSREDVFMSPQSSLIAYAKWEFKPREGKEGWLRFSKGDRIVNIGYTFQDQWCWSGQTKNGKWGLFPAAFVEGLQDGNTNAFGKQKSGSLFSKLTRGAGTVSKSVRSPSIRSSNSGGGRSSTSKTQPGLEVVVNGVAI